MTDSRPGPATASTPGIDGVRFGRLVRIADERGSFREIWRASEGPSGTTYVQANISTSTPGVLRGLHLHDHQDDHWVVVRGRALVALVDARPMLRTIDPTERPSVVTRELGPDEWVDIPRGVAHGFLALEDVELLYLVTNEYDGSDELGFAWDDPTAAVPWPRIAATPDGRPILSERDRTNPSLLELVARRRATR